MKQSQKWFYLAVVIVVGLLIYLLAPVLTPFAVAALLAYLGDPAADWLEARGLSRTLSVVVVFTLLGLFLALMLLILVPALETQLSRFARSLPAMISWAETHLQSWLERFLGPEFNLFETDRLIQMAREHGQEVGGVAANVLGSLSRSGLAVLGWVMNLLLIPVVAFYLLRDWDVLKDTIRGMLPRHIEPTVVRLAEDSNAVLGAFFRGQILVMVALGVIYAFGLWVIGIELALLIGLIAGLISFIPYLGTIVGVALGLLAALFQFQDVAHVLMVAGVFGLGQMLEGMVLTPLLVGDRIGLHPVVVIFAVLAGGQLFGFLGVLIALPAAAVIAVLLRHFDKYYRSSELYQRGGDTPNLMD